MVQGVVQESLLGGCLDPGEQAVLRLARAHRRVPEAVVQAQLGLSLSRYYQRLQVLLDRVDAADYDPELVGRLRAERDRRRRARGRAGPAGSDAAGAVRSAAQSRRSSPTSSATTVSDPLPDTGR